MSTAVLSIQADPFACPHEIKPWKIDFGLPTPGGLTPLINVYSSDEESVSAPSEPESATPSGQSSVYADDNTSTTRLSTKWSPADISYLVAILYPDLSVANQLRFVPPLNAPIPPHTDHSIKLFADVPLSGLAAEFVTQNVPSGLRAPVQRILIAESQPHCASKVDALGSLASTLLSDHYEVNRLCGYYGIRAALYSASEAELRSLTRGMWLLLSTSEAERRHRAQKLVEVGEDDVLEARVEKYLLDSELEHVVGLARLGEEILGLEGNVRREFAEVYGGAVEFLRRVVLW